MGVRIIHFIINPISGKGNNQLALEMVSKIFDSKDFDVKIKETLRQGHAKTLASKSVIEGANIVVACGGDGTVNEIASVLVETSTVLGIIPMGSGNGLASSLKIPKNTLKALNVIKNLNTIRVDVGEINKNYFFSNTGIGFTANVISNYSKARNRRFLSYLKATLLTILYTPPSVRLSITTNNESFNLRPFMVFVSNTNEMGYNISLTPQASIQDGELDAIVVEPLNKIEMICFAFLLLIRRPHNFKKAHCFLTQNIEIRSFEKEEFLAQVDGELTQIKSNQVNITIQKGAVSVLIP